jgi:hypothetical protein
VQERKTTLIEMGAVGGQPQTTSENKEEFRRIERKKCTKKCADFVPVGGTYQLAIYQQPWVA